MPRAKGGPKTRRRHKRQMKLASGFVGGRKLYRQARSTLEKGLTYAYRDRKAKKRQYRRLWIVRINAACRMREMRYSEFIHGLQLAHIALDRKSLSEIAIHDPATFDKLVEIAKKSVGDSKKSTEPKKK